MSTGKEKQRTYEHVPNLLDTSHGKGAGEKNGYVEPMDESFTLNLSKESLRKDIPDFPQLSEIEVVRHFTKLSQLNMSIDGNMYPLGSCTMKYNPKINEWAASLGGFASLHPCSDEVDAQGALELMYLLQEALTQITGLKACSLHPAAGAQGELVGVKMIRGYHQRNASEERDTILIPDSAHGTNPASAALSGFKVQQIPSNKDGIVEVERVRELIQAHKVAAIMITVPNTLGIFERNIAEIANVIHEDGGLVYCDGANLNALVAKVDFRAMGVDVMHINLHKTFSTPHGGGGPGAGPVVVSDRLVDFLPIPVVRKRDERFYFDYSVPFTVGKFRSFFGNFGMLVRALCYIYAFGDRDLSKISEVAVLNANYIRKKLEPYFHLPYAAPSLHEVVFSDRIQEKESGVVTMDIAKRLIDYGFHPPTVYFPLVVKGALMIEPTETESKAELDAFISAMTQIAQEAKKEPEKVKSAPHQTGIRRLDETRAARTPVLTWSDSFDQKASS